jgi:hypothetical protein
MKLSGAIMIEGLETHQLVVGADQIVLDSRQVIIYEVYRRLAPEFIELGTLLRQAQILGPPLHRDLVGRATLLNGLISRG